MRAYVARYTSAITVDGTRILIIGVAFAALLYMSIIGLKPWSIKEKTIPATGDGDSSRQLWYAATFAATLLATAKYPKYFLTLPVSLVLALAWCWLSATWAIEPSVSVRRLGLTTLIICTIFWCIGQLGYDRSVWIVRALLVFTLFMNISALWITPTAIHRAQDLGAAFGALDPGIVGSWRGILPHKNYAGAVCALSIIFFLFDSQRYPRTLRWIVIIGCAFFLLKTGSKTSMGLLVLSLLLGGFLSGYQPAYRALLIPFFTILVCIGTAVFLIQRDIILEPLSKPDAFTGRVQIWPATLGYARDHPWTGTGFGSFWNIGPNSPSFEYGRGWVAHLGSGHSGFFDLLAQIGFPGLLLVLMAVLVIPTVRIIGSTTSRRGAAGLVFAALTFCLCHNVTETSLFDRDSIVQVFLMISVALIGQVSTSVARPRLANLPTSRRVGGALVRTQ